MGEVQRQLEDSGCEALLPHAEKPEHGGAPASFRDVPESVKGYLKNMEEELAKYFPIACGDLLGRHFWSPVESM